MLLMLPTSQHSTILFWEKNKRIVFQEKDSKGALGAKYNWCAAAQMY